MHMELLSIEDIRHILFMIQRSPCIHQSILSVPQIRWSGMCGLKKSKTKEKVKKSDEIIGGKPNKGTLFMRILC